jgi:uncharacterized protein (DUF1499 family)
MRFVLSVLIAAVIGLCVLAIYAMIRSPGEPVHDALYKLVFGTPDLGRVELRALKRSGSRNDAFAAPPGYSRDTPPDLETAPVSGTPDDIFARVEDALRILGGSAALAESAVTPDGPMRRYVVRTRWLRFPDTLTVQLIKSAEGTGIALYSRSQIGSYDWGVNRKRINSIVAALR